MPLDATAVGRTIAQGAAKANAQAKAAGEHEHKATEIWTRTASGMGHQGATDLLHLPPNDFTSTPLSDIPGALKMQAGDLGGAVADIGKAEGALATTGAVFGALTAAEQLVSVAVSAIPFPAFPAVRIMDTDVGLPHAHAHPPNLIPPAPPVPLPSAGPVIPIPYVSGAETVLINEHAGGTLRRHGDGDLVRRLRADVRDLPGLLLGVDRGCPSGAHRRRYHQALHLQRPSPATHRWGR